MALQKHHKRIAVFLFWIGLILYFIGFVMLFYDVSSGPRDSSVERILIYFITFGLGTCLFLIAYWRMKQMNDVVSHKPLANDNDIFFTTRRMMFVSSVSPREPFTFYSLDGKVIATFQEEITTVQQLLRFTFGIIIPLNVFPLVLQFKAGNRTVSIEKRGGIFRPYYVYDENRKLLTKYELGKKILARYTLNIFDGTGKSIAVVKDDGSQSGYSVKSNDGKEFMFIRISGVPTEAMELFGTVEGDIVDIHRDHLTENEFLQLIATPLIMKYTMAR
ncbi:hypothetical protein BTR23_24590 [Alkalihalophilus pseudofirmus]|nr:hypothetical protein BTR23_24590 [Alkalihalophilus pseudofirmus]